ncbi:MAG TPA: asparaginase [Gemmatimonas aurantiaca]|uniref:Asparaginase n=2 Tax=Gemmatimonas aurantiaca TaxID=173480 RepID=A0A3D4VBV1_9BACT|nr:N(4)-(beta-N-acetylglucosaminyl)-L-asparaginase [Gemmatimonas aurantiaca]BAH37559.1 putative asparaginase [Gemmatimonas aurantiaca T-27]HCT58591.1 asparaginase [Gemmatimonas aurantiaca]
MSVTRRDFLERSAALAAAGFVPRLPDDWWSEATAAPPGTTPGFRARPVVVSSANGLRGVKVAYDRMQTGEDPLDAAIAGVNIQELDPEDQSVGLGGLPNEEGVVQLDASCMHGPTRRAGSVAAIEDIATPSLVAKAVMDYTDHVMLVGVGAKRFAKAMGFKEQNLLTDKSRQDWMRWKARLNANDAWLDHDDDIKIKFTTGTINMNAVNTAGDIASVTTTSGMAWKVPGRIGDSPIIGAGQYCDNLVGAAGSTGRGEANIKTCASFLAVEFMRQGLAPQEALMKTLERVVAMTETRLLGPNGRPKFDLEFYAITKDGRYTGATLYSGGKFAVCDERGARLEDAAFLYRR